MTHHRHRNSHLAITRRHLLQGGALATIAPALGAATGLPSVSPAHAQTSAGQPVWRHALSLFGDIKYPADFKRFDYVNPDAPKGGVARQISLGTFDNFNIAVAGVKGSIAPAAALIYETLMARSQDEVATEYGLLAEAASHPDDFAWVTYRLRKEARWHDGKPVTPEDVIFSIEVLKKYSPMYASYYRHVAKAEKIGERDIKFTFDSTGQSRTAAHRRRVAGTAEALLGRHRQPGPQARYLRDDAGAAAGLRPLSYQGVCRGPIGQRWSG